MAELLDLAREWTVDDLHKILGDWEIETGRQLDFRRFELIDGMLLMSPPAAPRHEFAASRLIVTLSRMVPTDYEVVPTVGVDLDRSYLIPDLLVVPSSRFSDSSTRLPPSDPLLVVEIVSPSSTTMDRVTKPAVYAAAGIAHYWRVETRPDVTIAAYALDGDAYREVGTWGPGETMTLARPFPLTVDLDELNRG